MSRRVVLLLVLAVVLGVGGATALVVTSRSALETSRATVDQRWTDLRVPIVARYAALGQVAQALSGAGIADRSYAKDLTEELARWNALTGGGATHPGSEAASANRLEALAARVRVDVAGSARLSRDAGIAGAFGAFDTALVPPPAVQAYNHAVHRYQKARTSTAKRLAARALGYQARPVLVMAPSGSG